MRIAVWHNLPSGGGKRALCYHVRGLLKRGHTLEAWCPPTADRSYLPLSDLVPEHVVPLSWPKDSSCNGARSAAATYRDLLEKVRAMDQHCQQCAQEINWGGFDLLFANACMFFSVPSIARYSRVPALIYLGEPRRQLYEALPSLPWIALHAAGRFWWSPRYLKRWVDNLIRVQALRVQAREEVLNAEAFASILVNSSFSRESVLRAYGLDAKVCYLGVDTALFVNRHEQRENFIVGIGALQPQKNIGFAIQALAKLRLPRPPLVWIGNVASSSYLDELVQLARSTGVGFEAKVRIPDAQLVDLLNRARMMIYAPRLEPFGLAPLEANACGLPVVAVAEGGVRETVIDGVNGLLTEHDPEAMAAAIGHLLEHRTYASQLGGAGCRLVTQRWSLDSAVERLEKRLMELTQAAASGSQVGRQNLEPGA